jgi:Co/Zn/Cd efflux system component
VTAWHALHGTLPHAGTMGAVGAAALLANMAVFGLLWAYRHGDANMRSVWICSRNDVLGNLAVLLAAAGVFGTGTGWPDIIVAAVMASLALQGAWVVIRDSLRELHEAATSVPMAAGAKLTVSDVFATGGSFHWQVGRGPAAVWPVRHLPPEAVPDRAARPAPAGSPDPNRYARMQRDQPRRSP